ncbi:hypothetical protein JOQ06_029564, partial [Pogonophryne albipinna]
IRVLDTSSGCYGFLLCLESYTPADVLIVAEANSPLQYPTQGVEVRPLKTIIIPGLGLKEEKGSNHRVYLTATLGVFDVAATVDETADTVHFATDGHQSFFTIKVGHGTIPTLYNTGVSKRIQY